jgi:hypothetical protein
MQASATEQMAAAKTAADAKQKADTDAENKRYASQKAGFAKELASLQAYLKRHPEEWKSAQDKVLALLGAYQVPYQKAGSDLSQSFIDGLVSQTKAIEKAAEGLAGAAGAKLNASPKKGASWVPAVGNPGAEGIMDVQAAAMHLLHPGEMVVRAREAGMMRDAMGAGSQSQTGAMMAGYIRTTRGFPLPQAWVNREAPLPLQGGYGEQFTPSVRVAGSAVVLQAWIDRIVPPAAPVV